MHEVDGTPGWAFTVGLYKSYRHPELIYFGVDSDIARNSDELSSLFESGVCRLNNVMPLWYEWFLGLGIWFYGGAEFPLLQMSWSEDALHPLLSESGQESAGTAALIRTMQP